MYAPPPYPAREPISSERSRRQQKYWICCCHVETLAFALAVVSIVCAALEIIREVGIRARYQKATTTEFTGLFTSISAIILNSLVIYAQRIRQPKFYLPYLIIAGIGLVLLTVGWLIMLFLVLYLWFNAASLTTEQHNDMEKHFWDFIMFGFLLLLSAFNYHIFWSAWRFLVDEKKSEADARQALPLGKWNSPC